MGGTALRIGSDRSDPPGPGASPSGSLQFRSASGGSRAAVGAAADEHSNQEIHAPAPAAAMFGYVALASHACSKPSTTEHSSRRYRARAPFGATATTHSLFVFQNMILATAGTP